MRPLLFRRPTNEVEIAQRAALEKTLTRFGFMLLIVLNLIMATGIWLQSSSNHAQNDFVACQLREHRTRNEEAHAAIERTLIRISQAAHVPLTAAEYQQLLLLEQPTPEELNLPNCPATANRIRPLPTVTSTVTVRQTERGSPKS